MSDHGAIRELFLRALDLPEHDREGFLRRHAESEEIRRRIVTLLAHHRESSRFLETPAAAALPPAAGHLPFEELGGFRLLREIGRGGAGIVYLAENESLGELSALKILFPTSTRSERLLKRFHHEAKIASRLDHPALLRVQSYGSEHGYHYLASRFIAGHDLAKDIALRREGDLPPRSGRDCAALVAPLADGLSHAHDNHVIHRDVKPSNILIDESGVAYLGDFGLAADQHREVLTRTGELMGTIHYMSPEQARMRPKDIDRRTDIFSLGVVLYEMISGHRPFEATTATEVLRRIEKDSPKALSPSKYDIPPGLEVICAKCLEKDPQHRYATAAELAADLDLVARAQPIRSHAPGWIERTQRGLRRLFRRSS